MIWFLYGKNPFLIQENIQRALKENSYAEKIYIPEENIDLGYFNNLICTPNIFGGNILILVPLKEIPEELIIKYLDLAKNKINGTDILFYFNGNLSSKSTIIATARKNKNIKIIEVKEEKDWTLFNLADAIFEKNKEKAYKLLRNLELKSEDPIAIHTVLSNHLRSIARVKFGASVNLAPFVLNKIRRQIKNFSDNEILNLYRYFYKMDKELKTGSIKRNVAMILLIEQVFKEVNCD